MAKIDLTRYLSTVAAAHPVRFHGKVTQVVGLVIEGYCPETVVGSLC
jgi:flagellum-specific ATP synthase